MMKMKMSFWCRVKNLIHIQNLVKQYNGRFVYNPLIIKNQANVVLSFEEIDKANKFNAMKCVTEQSYF